MATLVKLSGPSVIGAGIKMATYSLAFDSSYPTGGEIVDLSADFTNVHSILMGGNDTLADDGYCFAAVHPGVATVVSATNVKIAVHLGGTTNAVLEEATGNLSAIGALLFTVIGK